MEVENEDEQGIRKHKSRLGSLLHGSIGWREQILSRTHRNVTLSFKFSLPRVQVPEWNETFAVSLLASCTKINNRVYPLERWKRFHMSLCAGGGGGQHVRCKSGTMVTGRTK